MRTTESVIRINNAQKSSLFFRDTESNLSVILEATDRESLMLARRV